MFSRSGASTLTTHKVFKSKFTDINEFVADKRVAKKHIGTLSSMKNEMMLDEPLSGDISAQLPSIAENEEN